MYKSDCIYLVNEGDQVFQDPRGGGQSRKTPIKVPMYSCQKHDYRSEEKWGCTNCKEYTPK